MKDKRWCVIVRRVTKTIVERNQQEKAALLRLDLSHQAYASWFLSEKIVRGQLLPSQSLNDFVLFRIGYGWPKGAKWFLNELDIHEADFSLTDTLAAELCEFADEQLSDGYQTADWFLRLAAVRYADQGETMPASLFTYLQRALFQVPEKRSGRKKKDGLDRDRVIRNAFNGLCARDCGIEHAKDLLAGALGQNGVNITADGVGKVVKRTIPTDRETKLWKIVRAKWAESDLAST